MEKIRQSFSDDLFGFIAIFLLLKESYYSSDEMSSYYFLVNSFN